MVYVGQTLRKVRIRVSERKRSISNFNPTDKKTHILVGRHFHTAKHNAASLKWMVVAQVERPLRGGDRKKFLLKYEAKWIGSMKSVEPLGMNEAWSLKIFL
ncbi:hypothetical protein XELAEV_18016248mg [Xenopus laevis]|uniref:Uncharacterized protein n=1 Tax=Xenopus laevis TaxID=8355 RepID=A0A974HWP3_XENLA|nr:hypothetical protein XELAEV_18016248mg [Xenopus laevis]